MGDFFRFLATTDCDVSLQSVEAIFKAIDSRFAIHVEPAEPNLGDLYLASQILGDVEINRPGDQVFDEDIAELIEAIEGDGDTAAQRVIAQLHDTKVMVALQLTEDGHEAYDMIDPLWDVLFERCPGLLQVDEEGYYDQKEIVLAVD